MPYMLILLSIFCVLAILYTCAKMVQLTRFSKFMHICLDELYEGEKWKFLELNIRESYSNFEKSLAWNYNFRDMVVYETRRIAA